MARVSGLLLAMLLATGAGALTGTAPAYAATTRLVATVSCVDGAYRGVWTAEAGQEITGVLTTYRWDGSLGRFVEDATLLGHFTVADGELWVSLPGDFGGLIRVTGVFTDGTHDYTFVGDLSAALDGTCANGPSASSSPTASASPTVSASPTASATSGGSTTSTPLPQPGGSPRAAGGSHVRINAGVPADFGTDGGGSGWVWSLPFLLLLSVVMVQRSTRSWR